MDNFKEVIEKITTRILEDWGMMMLENADVNQDIFDSESPFYLATIHFKGVVDGKYFILCQKDFMDSLASNLLGEDEITDTERKDALSEMANVLCGNMLTECYGDDTTFDLVLPAIIDPTDEIVGEIFKKQTVCYLADEAPVAISFDLDL
ncbi:MAG: chemotaxis protein CheX [Bdellovibrionales bacterium]|nr:chemotaxis protein CheX [Bdellovibrionales bacterium]